MVVVALRDVVIIFLLVFAAPSFASESIADVLPQARHAVGKGHVEFRLIHFHGGIANDHGDRQREKKNLAKDNRRVEDHDGQAHDRNVFDHGENDVGDAAAHAKERHDYEIQRVNAHAIEQQPGPLLVGLRRNVVFPGGNGDRRQQNERKRRQEQQHRELVEFVIVVL